MKHLKIALLTALPVFSAAQRAHAETQPTPHWEFAAEFSPTMSSGKSPVEIAPDAPAGTRNPVQGKVLAQPRVVLSGAYRFEKYLSAGAFFGFAQGDNDHYGIRTGVLVRAYPLAAADSLVSLTQYVEPWISVGAGYYSGHATRSEYTSSNDAGAITSVSTNTQYDQSGLLLPLSVGLDIHILRYLSIGPSLEYAYTMGNHVSGSQIVQTSISSGAAGDLTSSDFDTSRETPFRARSAGQLSYSVFVKVTPF